MTIITLPRAIVEQALEALKDDQYRMVETAEGCWEYKTDLAIAALEAALAQQAEPVEPVEPVECSNTFGCRCPKHFAAQQAEPDHETRAELAEQQVVQLAEERDHYRGLWQKAQQAEPYRLPDDLYDSTDWRAGTYAERVAWLSKRDGE